MLEFNEQHKSADLSPINNKLEKAKQAGKIALSGILISATIMFSGCGRKTEVPEPDSYSVAIVIEGDNALIIDIKRFNNGANGTQSNYITLETLDGLEIVVAVENVQIIKKDKNSHEIAESIAKSLISEDGKITYYDDIVENKKTK